MKNILQVTESSQGWIQILGLCISGCQACLNEMHSQISCHCDEKNQKVLNATLDAKQTLA